MSRTFSTRWLTPRGVTGLSILVPPLPTMITRYPVIREGAFAAVTVGKVPLFRGICQVVEALQAAGRPGMGPRLDDPARQERPAAAGTTDPVAAGLEFADQHMQRQDQEQPAHHRQ